VLWLTFVAAVFACWFIDHRSVATTKAALEAERRAMQKKEKASLEFAIEVAKKVAEQYDDRLRPIYYPPKNDGS
jgi:hypothetical protein